MLLSNRNFLSLDNCKVKVTMSMGSGLKGLLTVRGNKLTTASGLMVGHIMEMGTAVSCSQVAVQ